MKKFFTLIITLLLIDAIHAQEQTFMRIYNITGNKFQKGYFVGTTDSSVFIYRKSGIVEIPATGIGYIKTKRSVVHTILVSTLTVAVPITVLGVTPAKTYWQNDTINRADNTSKYKTATGDIVNTSTGTTAPAFMKRATFIIKGNKDTWRLQKRMMDTELVVR